MENENYPEILFNFDFNIQPFLIPKIMNLKTTLSLLATLLLFGCGGNANSTENNVSDKKKEKSTLNTDPCQLAFEQIKNMADGPDVFMKPMFNYDDFQEVKRNYPDLQKYYQMYRDIKDGTMEDNPQRWGGRFNDSNPVLILYAYEKEKGGDLKKNLETLMKEYYSDGKEQLLNEGWIWSEIEYNDCEFNEYYFEEGVYKYADQRFQLPNMKNMTIYLNKDGESIPIAHTIIETKEGWKILLPSVFYSFLGE